MKVSTIWLVAVLPTHAQTTTTQEALAAVDLKRIQATISRDESSLRKILAEDLHYAHSTGIIDDRESLVARLKSGATRYLSFEYLTRDFKIIDPTIALMSGHVRIKSESQTKGMTVNTLSFLAVWKRTDDGWKFHAWQSSVVPPIPAH